MRWSKNVYSIYNFKPIFFRGDYKTEIKLEWVGLYIGYVANAMRIHKQGSNSKDSWTTNSIQSRSDTLPLQTTPRYFFKWPIYHQRKFLEAELCTKSVFLRASAVANRWPKKQKLCAWWKIINDWHNFSHAILFFFIISFTIFLDDTLWFMHNKNNDYWLKLMLQLHRQ